MKKLLMVFLVVSLAVCMVACGEKEIDENNLGNNLAQSGDMLESETEKITRQYFLGNDLNVYAESQVIEFEEESETGYEWIYVLENANIIEVVRDEFVRNISGDISGDEIKSRRICEIKGLTEGETRISFECIKGIELNEVPVEKVTFNVAVNANKEVAIIEEIL